MKPYMSYWSAGYKKTPDDYILNLHKISAFFLKKNFGEVHLITDTKSKDLFKNMNFTSISTDLDNLPSSYGDVWSLGKIYTYKLASLKGDPFLHVDYDVILWEGLLDGSDKSNIITQSVEVDAINWYQVDKFIKNCPNIGLLKNLKLPLDSYNCGILGGHDLKFLYDYSSSALDLVLDEKNKDFFIKNYYLFNGNWEKAAIMEQYYLSVCAEYYNKKIDTYIINIYDNNHVCNEKKYTHLWGAKTRPEIQDKIKKLIEVYHI